ncbi:MAG: radical SAM protein [Deltaproteobacteria bacterium]|nr:radical SAM protein [Deltaproteobacteria bacterium]
MSRESEVEMEVLRVSGDPEVAVVGVSRFRGQDRFTVETVDGLTPPQTRDQKWIINVSTQFGCPVGCPFCDAGGGYAGNPSCEELLAQVKWGLSRHPGVAAKCQKLKVHFARMGEPSLNDAVLDAMERLPETVRSAGLWCCVATVAPRNREPWFERLHAVKERYFRGCFQLQFSVQSTDPADRQRLTPVPHWSLSELADYGLRFHEPDDRKVVLNFALARDIEFDPAVIEQVFDRDHFAIKLTPVNPTARGHESGFQTVLRSGQAWTIERACDRLLEGGFDVVLSIGDEREDLIGSNCGQAVRVAREHAARAMAG